MSNISIQNKRLFTYALSFLTALGLMAIWYPRFPAMQDYPQSLFMAHVVSSFNNIELNWSEYYVTNQQIGPYSLFFMIVSLLAKVVPVEVAGKVFISLALCLTTVFVYAWNRFYATSHPAWSLLLLLPLLFSQVYYMGFVNYLISIPILFLTLLVHEKIVKQSINPGTVISYLALLILLFLAHPYTILVFIILSFIISMSSSATKKQFVIGLVGPLLTVILFALWYVNTFDISTTHRPGAFSIRWWPVYDVFRYFFLPFVGMRITSGPNILILLAWSTIALLFLFAWLKQKSSPRFRLPFLIMLLLSIAGYAILPFWLGDYSYFNLRMSIVCYFLLALTLGNIQLGKWPGYLFVILVSSIMLMTIKTQMALSAETEELLPLFGHMKKNELVYSLDIDASPAAIDKRYFYQFHSHDHFYYHMVVGGGAASTLFNSKMNPITFKEGVTMPNIFAEPQFYQYILVRGQLPQEELFGSTHQLVARSATWWLYRRYSSPMQKFIGK
jgi:hypothetical protein